MAVGVWWHRRGKWRWVAVVGCRWECRWWWRAAGDGRGTRPPSCALAVPANINAAAAKIRVPEIAWPLLFCADYTLREGLEADAGLLQHRQFQVIGGHEQAAFGDALRARCGGVARTVPGRARAMEDGVEGFRTLGALARPIRARTPGGSGGCRPVARRRGGRWLPGPPRRKRCCGSRRRPGPDGRGRWSPGGRRGVFRRGGRNRDSWFRWRGSGRRRNVRCGRRAGAGRRWLRFFPAPMPARARHLRGVQIVRGGEPVEAEIEEQFGA